MFLLIARHPFQKVNSSITTSQKIYTNVIEKKSNHQLVWCRLLTPSRSIAWLKHIEASTWCLLAHFVGQTTTQNIHNRSALGRPLEAWQLGKLERLHPARSQPHMAMGWKTQHNWSCEILRCRTNLLNCTSKYLVYRAFSCFLLEGIPFKSCILIVANGREMGYTVCLLWETWAVIVRQSPRANLCTSWMDMDGIMKSSYQNYNKLQNCKGKEHDLILLQVVHGSCKKKRHISHQWSLSGP